MADTFSLQKISIGDRHRKDLGDIDGLARSISEVGLLHPIVVRSDGTLVAGERRLSAVKTLGWTDVPVTVIDIDEIARGEFAENAIRKDFLPTEIDAIRRELEPAEKEAAKTRMLNGRPLGKFSPKGRVRDKVGAFAGVSGRTVEKIAAVVKAAAENPEEFGDLPAEMDRTGKVDPVFAKVARQRKHQEIARRATEGHSAAILGPFPVILADPPWRWGHFNDPETTSEAGKGRTPDQHYPTLTFDEIADFRIGERTVQEIAHRDAALFLWCTSSNLPGALDVMDAWGFEFKTSAVWVKPSAGMGLVFRNRHEVLLYGTRGSMPGPRWQPGSVFECARGKHSQKPVEVREAIERMYPDFGAEQRLELFARDAPEGWTAAGFEAG